MLACDSCKKPKPDVRKRPLLRVIDQTGARTLDPFDGMLCDDCHLKTQQFGTSEHLLVLERITRTSHGSRKPESGTRFAEGHQIVVGRACRRSDTGRFVARAGRVSRRSRPGCIDILTCQSGTARLINSRQLASAKRARLLVSAGSRRLLEDALCWRH
jgi:hypothetical protein